MKKEDKRKKYYIGIDEVGRGCLAGPVTVAAVAIPSDSDIWAIEGEFNDSKKMTPLGREKWAAKIREKEEIFYEICSLPAQKVDEINISAAASLAAYKAFGKLIKKLETDSEIKVTLDGGLYLRDKCRQAMIIQKKKIEARTVIKADANYKEVMLASIVAKVFRDSKMTRLAKKYPGFGFAEHKGYGTKAHMKAIRENGPITGLHRQTYLKKLI